LWGIFLAILQFSAQLVVSRFTVGKHTSIWSLVVCQW